MTKHTRPITLIAVFVMALQIPISSFSQSGGNRSPNIDWGNEAHLTMRCSKIYMALWGFNIKAGDQESINNLRRITESLNEFSYILAAKANIPKDRFERETKSYIYPLTEKIVSGRTTKQETSQALADSESCIRKIMSNATLLDMFRPIYQKER